MLPETLSQGMQTNYEARDYLCGQETSRNLINICGKAPSQPMACSTAMVARKQRFLYAYYQAEHTAYHQEYYSDTFLQS